MTSGAFAKTTSGEDGALMIGTRVSVTVQGRNTSCPNLDFTCDNFMPISPKASMYIGGLEDATIVIQNSVSKATQTLYGGSGSSLIIDSFDPDRPVAWMHGTSTGRKFQVQSKSFGDMFTVANLTWVAGIEPDEVIPDPSTPGQNASVRYDGQTVRIRVVYTGDRTKWNSNATYEYWVGTNDMEAKNTWADESDSPNYEVVADGTGGYELKVIGTNATRTLYDLHGLQLIYSQEANLNVFDISTLFVSLLSGAGLLFMAKLAADSFLLYLAPKRADYRLFVEQLTPDFSPDSEGERQVLEKILTKKRASRARVEHGRLTQDADHGPTPPLAAADALGAVTMSISAAEPARSDRA